MRPAPRRVVLIGSMGSGKSTVGPVLADLLGWAFADADAELEREAGQSVADVFAAEGEAGFRRREAATMRRLLERDGLVVASGGGWAAQAEAWEALDADTRTVWLRVGPSVAHRRVREDAGRARPLVSGPDPFGTVERLIQARAPWYGRADLVLETDDAGPREIAERIARTMKETP
ncbi:MAG: shikimate kinase [Gemmatimonadota bacterium]|nr:shikimate kinase [Gemmatimonadota bacterium]